MCYFWIVRFSFSSLRGSVAFMFYFFTLLDNKYTFIILVTRMAKKYFANKSPIFILTHSYIQTIYKNLQNQLTHHAEWMRRKY